MLGSVLSSCAQSGLQTRSIFMYKNGFAYAVSAGKVPLKDGKWSLQRKDIPPASMGSLWFQSPAGINYVKRETDTLLKAVARPGLDQLIRANVGKRLGLVLTTGDVSTRLEGTIEKYFELPAGETDLTANPAVAVLKTATGKVVLYRETLAHVLAAEFADDVSYEAKEKTPEPKLSVYFKNTPGSADLSMVYLQQHGSWSPEYRMVLTGDTKAKLTLGAEVSSGNTEMKNTELNLVVGAPEFSKGYTLSRLCGGESIAVDDWESPKAEENKAYFRNTAAGVPAPGGIEVSASKAEDYYMYTLKNFSLQKNEHAWVQILEENMDVQHYFTCGLPPVNEYSAPVTDDGNANSYLDVYHKLKFKNPAKQTLTAAPVFVETEVSGSTVALSQPVLETVPVGGAGIITLARSTDIPVKETDTEVKRTPNAYSTPVSRYGTSTVYDLVQMKSTVSLENQGSKEVKLELAKSISGKFLSSDAPNTVRTLKPDRGTPNANNLVTWEITLKPGEKKSFSFTFEYYLRQE
ncbi:MAG: hypothetical protein JNL57_11415 [Bacteroidetes bacterium]|nr:hypothetical protein [Bacteroidota bacterium]